MNKEAKQALQIAIDYMNDRLEDHDCKYQRHPATEAERINILADIETVKEALAKQEKDWSLLEATQESLREHMAMLKELQVKQEQGDPVVGTKTWFEDGKIVTQNLYYSDVYKGQEQGGPVAWYVYFGNEDEPNYAVIGEKPNEPRAVIRPLIFGDTTPQPIGFAVMERPWIELTDEDKASCVQATAKRGSTYELIAAIEAKLKEKNT